MAHAGASVDAAAAVVDAAADGLGAADAADIEGWDVRSYLVLEAEELILDMSEELIQDGDGDKRAAPVWIGDLRRGSAKTAYMRLCKEKLQWSCFLSSLVSVALTAHEAGTVVRVSSEEHGIQPEVHV